MGDFIVIAALVLVSVLIIGSLIRQKKKGNCCGSCSGCSANCPHKK